SASALLAVTRALRHGVDGREPLRRGDGRGLRDRAARRRVRVHHPDAGASRRARQGLAARQGAGEGLQGKDLDRLLRRRDSTRLRPALDLGRAVRAGGGDLAVPRPAIRKAARRIEGVAPMEPEKIKVRVTETGQTLDVVVYSKRADRIEIRSEEHTSELQSRVDLVC